MLVCAWNLMACMKTCMSFSVADCYANLWTIVPSGNTWSKSFHAYFGDALACIFNLNSWAHSIHMYWVTVQVNTVQFNGKFTETWSVMPALKKLTVILYFEAQIFRTRKNLKNRSASWFKWKKKCGRGDVTGLSKVLSRTQRFWLNFVLFHYVVLWELRLFCLCFSPSLARLWVSWRQGVMSHISFTFIPPKYVMNNWTDLSIQ